MKKLINILVTCLLVTSAFGQKATITGTVMSLENGTLEPQPFATVMVKGSHWGASADMEGNFRFQLEPGTYALVVSHVGYMGQERTVELVAQESVSLHFELRAEGIEMQPLETKQGPPGNGKRLDDGDPRGR